MRRAYVTFVLLVLLPGIVKADDALIAVATNFARVAELLVAEFEHQHSYGITISSGSTGKLYAQIVNGAPFDVLLAADTLRPAILEQNRLAPAGFRFTYATGRLSLWSPDPTLFGSDGKTVLANADIAALAIANPDLAPYGRAARETLESLKLWSRLQDRIVMGENIGQAHALVATHNATLGFVATSYLQLAASAAPQSRWDVPSELHTPIRQDAVLLAHGKHNEAAKAFLQYLKSRPARTIIETSGYDAG